MAATSYGVPKSTLHDKIKENTPMTPQPRTVLSTPEETRLVDWVTEISNIGYGRTKPELLNTVKTILDKDGRSTPFKERGGGQKFSISFWMRFRQVPLCSYEFKVIFDNIIFFTLGQYYRIYKLLIFQHSNYDMK